MYDTYSIKYSPNRILFSLEPNFPGSTFDITDEEQIINKINNRFGKIIKSFLLGFKDSDVGNEYVK